MVNGVPASGKSAVADLLGRATGWPVYALDTVKDLFLAELGPVDRTVNRTLGRASYRTIFALLAATPPRATAIVDAWFGFQPRDLLTTLLAEAGVDAVLELWCHAPPELVAARYRDRAGERLPGHPGPDYAEELRQLAARAEPMRIGPVHPVDTSRSTDHAAVSAFIDANWR